MEGEEMMFFEDIEISEDERKRVAEELRVKMEEDPYTIPFVKVPALSKKVTTKWYPFGDNPTEEVVAFKAELQEEVRKIEEEGLTREDNMWDM